MQNCCADLALDIISQQWQSLLRIALLYLGPLSKYGRDTIDKRATGFQRRFRIIFGRLNASGRKQVDQNVGVIVAQGRYYIDWLLLRFSHEAREVVGVAV